MNQVQPSLLPPLEIFCIWRSSLRSLAILIEAELLPEGASSVHGILELGNSIGNGSPIPCNRGQQKVTNLSQSQPAASTDITFYGLEIKSTITVQARLHLGPARGWGSLWGQNPCIPAATSLLSLPLILLVIATVKI